MRAPLRIFAAAVAALAVTPAAAPAASDFRGAIRSDPGLTPQFRKGTPDYVVSCPPGKPVTLRVDPPEGTRVAVGAGEARAGEFKRSVGLVPGSAVRVRIVSEGKKRTYSIRCLPGDFRNFRAERHGRPQAEWYLVTPDLHRRGGGYVAVFDNHGVPVWWMRQDFPPFDVHLLPDGNLAWTNWSLPLPSERYQSRALDGRLVRYYRSPTTRHTNQHELQVAPDDSALFLIYPIRDGVDLSRWGGPKQATVFDGEVQEIDPQGRLAWRWNSSDHLATKETAPWFREIIHNREPVDLPDGRKAYDIIHLNSIEPVGDDRLVLSMRHTNAVYMIDRSTGAIVWKLGGTKTSKSLKVKGDRYAPKIFDGQHDPRMAADRRTLTLFDNGTRKKRRPRVLEFRLNMTERTATLKREFGYTRAERSTCCGSTRKLPGGNFVTSWGNTPFVTEQTGSGRLVLLLVLGDSGSSYRVEPVAPGVLERSALRRGMDAMATP